ncbi:MAG: glycerol-3-phosphate dehydrogenase [Rhodobacterales bacterium 65-51]|jgi:glycerol-3-phosphate dehydrogenase (NAD(P)+)|uniref:Glycerol-3-phosphate dehydrogenase [NAD(P)+] n=1 Tax=Gemmobacter nanjingensis TaxID=488454 RepID=A0ABQ3FSB3_9RHOB|nr:NAD(P)H-dependent glycerol-3-phosphate dehydrogenase [Gemmobacter nanjingensis]OJY27930.1 MAG: glycerol-3-phosphate dehydrogenase [Rhodobacterales bacterium 65-51]GHC38401.1 glycerol-3-phosphate dehydrogenase [NAD(P)+] [Gemmobacter nanjingensis]
MKIAILGSGAFGAALAAALGREGPVVLWGRGQAGREIRRLPGLVLPGSVTVTADLAQTDDADLLLLSVPMQALGRFVADHGARLASRPLVACCKGVDLTTGLGPVEILDTLGGPAPAVLTGPSFAADIAIGLPTALTLACRDDALGAHLQARLSTPVLRLYRTPDVIGAELGGALKNVMAIAAGVVIGAGLGDSARAALMTRGYAEMLRFALARGARAETLAGLSGFGDLVLTCTSAQSRNFSFGLSLGRGESFDPATTVEGAATARAVAEIGRTQALDLPVSTAVAALVDGRITVTEAIQSLLSRPLKQE